MLNFPDLLSLALGPVASSGVWLCEVFWKLGSSRGVCRGLQDKQPSLRPSLPSLALDRELFAFKRILQPELKTHCLHVSGVEYDLKEAV